MRWVTIPRRIEVLLRKPNANTLYESNMYLYKTDGQGRLSEVSGQLRSNKATRNPGQQALVGKASGITGDEGGHMIAAMFDGPGEGPLHLTPQSWNLNRGKGSKWRAMENKWKAALERGDSVRVNIEIKWDAAGKRPERFDVTYSIMSGSSGDVSDYVNSFPNQ